MVNCNPETVSTDYDTSDRLYFEPLTDEDVANVLDAELAAGGKVVGVIVSLGGQTPLKLAGSLPPELVLGTSPASIDLAEDRERWNALCHELAIPQPPGGTATTTSEALAVAGQVGYPVLLRPSYVLGGRAMEIVYDDDGRAPRHAVHDHRRAGPRGRGHGRAARAGGPLLGGRGRGRRRRRARRRRRDPHRRRHGARGGGRRALGRLGLRAAAADAARRRDRAARAPHPGAGRVARRVRPDQRAVRGEGRAGLRARGQPAGEPHGAVRGQGDRRAAGHGGLPGHGGPDAGRPAQEGLLRRRRRRAGCRCSTTSASRRRCSRSTASPASTRCSGPRCARPARSWASTSRSASPSPRARWRPGTRLPDSGTVFLSLADRDKPAGLEVARAFGELGFSIAATLGTAGYLRAEGLAVDTLVAKVGEEGVASDAVELIAQGKVQLVVNTPRGLGPAGRRPAHPHRLGGLQGALPHHAGGGPGGRGRHRRRAVAPAPGAGAAGPAPGPRRDVAVSAAPDGRRATRRSPRASGASTCPTRS